MVSEGEGRRGTVDREGGERAGSGSGLRKRAPVFAGWAWQVHHPVLSFGSHDFREGHGPENCHDLCKDPQWWPRI